ncbi:MAG: hypothetical protein PHD76_08540 [Methylacidiphilales bacterium]|nr:hypothetical protein [Candidatus Methylacidiphilales bacterium]
MKSDFYNQPFWLAVSLAAILSFESSGAAQDATPAAPAPTAPVVETSAAPAVPKQEAAAPSDAEANPLVQEETVKRLEGTMLFNKQLEEADRLVAAGEITAARPRYEQVYKQTSPDGPMSGLYFKARKGLAIVSAEQARQAAAKKDYAQARQLWEEALSYDPDNASYKSAYAQVKEQSQSVAEKYPGNTAATPELQDKVANIQKLIFEGDSFYETGQYNRAIGRYKEVLLIDPYNNQARQRIEKTENIKYQVASIRREERKTKMLQQVDAEWATQPRPQRTDLTGTSVSEATSSDVSKMYDKLEKIIIPECNFTDADVADVLRYLQEQSKVIDPKGEGVNFVLKGEPTALNNPAPAAAPGGAAAAEAPAPPPSIHSLSLNLRNLSLLKILGYIPELTTYKFKVEEYAVYFFPNTETSDVMVVKSYSVPPTFFPQTLKTDTTTVGALNNATVNVVTVDVKKALEERGVKFANGASAAYLPKTAKLVARNTLDQLNLIEQLVGKEANAVSQVEVEAKFIEFTEDKLKDFASNFRVNATFKSPITIPNITGAATGTGGIGAIGNGRTPNFGAGQIGSSIGGATALRDSTDELITSPNSLDALLGLQNTRSPNLISVTGILAGSQAQLLISALESKLGADLMSAPKVTVVSGQKTKIRVVREFRYPTEWEAPQIPQSTGGGGNNNVSLGTTTVIPSNPTNFVSRDVGVTLDVKANATADRRIDLELKPDVTEFQGFINYGGDATTLGVNGTISEITDPFGFLFFFFTPSGPPPIVTVATGTALTPVFSLRSVETKLQVIDGQTVVMGGFIRSDNKEIEDKVPVLGDVPLLGRLFRSKVSQTVKRNLVMFITARMIRADGSPEYLTEGEKETMEVSSLPGSGETK